MFTIARSAYLILIKFPRQSVLRFPRVLGTSCALPTVVRGDEARRIAANIAKLPELHAKLDAEVALCSNGQWSRCGAKVTQPR